MTSTSYFEYNLDRLFQTAVLLVSDPEAAKAALRNAIASLDISRPPAQNATTVIERLILLSGVSIHGSSFSLRIANARRVLRTPLRRVVELKCVPRTCFVLLIVVGYATSTCALILGTEEHAVRVLLHLGLLQLRRALSFAGNRQQSISTSNTTSDCIL